MDQTIILQTIMIDISEHGKLDDWTNSLFEKNGNGLNGYWPK